MEDRTLSRIGIISDAVSNLNDKHMNALFGSKRGEGIFKIFPSPFYKFPENLK